MLWSLDLPDNFDATTARARLTPTSLPAGVSSALFVALVGLCVVYVVSSETRLGATR